MPGCSLASFRLISLSHFKEGASLPLNMGSNGASTKSDVSISPHFVEDTLDLPVIGRCIVLNRR